jgi:hypothetical protein
MHKLLLLLSYNKNYANPENYYLFPVLINILRIQVFNHSNSRSIKSVTYNT